MAHIILGSQSPRRKELLLGAGFKFDVFSPEMDETFSDSISVYEVPSYLAEMKGKLVLDKFGTEKIIITADTVVILQNKIIGKPRDLTEAKQILSQLSGKVHEVVTGVCLQFKNEKTVFSDTTKVYFNELKTTEIDYFVDNYKPLDKAGAYAIQEWIGYIGVCKIEGCFYNVMGLPIPLVYKQLKEWGG